MSKRFLLIAGPAVAATALIVSVAVPSGRALQEQRAVEAFEAPVDVDTNRLRGPRQPIFFRHDVHAGQYQMDCQYCHVNLEISPKPGIPTVAMCMGCHQFVGSGNPEVQKLREASAEGRAIEWVEIHQLAQFVHFPHMRHVLADVDDLDCETCHGAVDREPQIYQFASLKMGWCLDCHKTEDVSTDCTTCHY